MRLPNKCDEMNLTGCTEWHNWLETGSGFSHWLAIHQIEAGIALGIVMIGLIYISIKLTKNNSWGTRGKI